tara:strand:- start:656 stop:937 length:282 start_codon:yes stop_codon:yes gene_type:complete
MIIKPFLKILLIATVSFPSQYTKADFLLVIGTYRQGPGNRPEVSGITSPSLYSLPMKDIETCKIAGEKITNEIYKPVWQFDSRWTCIKTGLKN